MSKPPRIFVGVAAGLCALGASLGAAAAQPTGPAAPAGAAVVVRDTATGQLRPASAPEIKALAADVDRLLDRGTAAPRKVTANGRSATIVNGNFGSVAVARRNADGKLELSCFDEAAPAKRFLGLAPAAAPSPAPKAEEK